MSINNSYFSKNNTIISNSLTNTGRNPVTELFYGSLATSQYPNGFSRFIFDLDLTLLKEKVSDGVISTGCTDNMVHTLRMVNTSTFNIDELNTTTSQSRLRATSFDLILFRIPETIGCVQTTPQINYTQTVRNTYPNAVFAEKWGTYTNRFITNQGYSPSNIVYAEGICSDDVDAPKFRGNIGQFPNSMDSFLGPFMSGGLAGFPFVGSVGLGAWASHVTNTGTLFISSMPHIGITENGDVGYMYRRGQGSYLSNTCGAVAGAIGWVTSSTQAPQYTSFTGGGNYEFYTLTDILWPYKSTLTGMTYGQQMKFATDTIRDAAEQFIVDNLPASVTGQTSSDVYFCNGTFINTDDGKEAYVEINRFKRYNTVLRTWTDLTSTYLDGLTGDTTSQICTTSPQSWDEGVGYDFADLIYNYSNSDKNFSLRPSNWIQTTTLNNWTEPGIYNNKNNGIFNFDELTIVDTQHFEFGNENISFDMTSEINTLLNNGIPGFSGWGIAYKPQIENLTGLTENYEVQFFTRHTQTFYEPLLETNYNDIIEDDRNTFSLGKVNKLYLYLYEDGSPINLDSLPTVTISDANGSTINSLTPTLEICQRTKGVYEVTIPPLLGYQTPCSFYDVWSDLVINGFSIPDITNSFTVYPLKKSIQIGTTTQDPKIYGFDFYGIKQDEKIYNTDIRKVGVVIKQAYTTNKLLPNVVAHYRVYVREGQTEVEVQDWTKINRTPNEYYFIFDTRDKIPNEYYIDLKIISSGEINTYKKQIKFQIVNLKYLE